MKTSHSHIITMDSIYDKYLSLESHLRIELRSHDMISRILCGGIAGIVAKTAIAPAERVKMSFQVSNDQFSLMNALKRGYDIIKNHGMIYIHIYKYLIIFNIFYKG